MNIPNTSGRGFGQSNNTVGMSDQEQAMVKLVCQMLKAESFKLMDSYLQMTAAMESCAGKTIMSGGECYLGLLALMSGRPTDMLKAPALCWGVFLAFSCPAYTAE